MIVKVGGMSCQGCVNSVTKVLQALPGVTRVDVSLERGEAVLTHEPGSPAREAVLHAIDEAGFEAA